MHVALIRTQSLLERLMITQLMTMYNLFFQIGNSRL